MDRDCLQAMGLPCLTFFDCLNLHFACRDKIGTGQNRPFYPCFGPLRGSWSSKNWFGMAHQVVRYVTQPLRPHTMQQQKRWHFYNGGESVFLGRTPMRGINLQQTIAYRIEKVHKHRIWAQNKDELGRFMEKDDVYVREMFARDRMRARQRIRVRKNKFTKVWARKIKE